LLKDHLTVPAEMEADIRLAYSEERFFSPDSDRLQ
jgi:hypothetical protein